MALKSLPLRNLTLLKITHTKGHQDLLKMIWKLLDIKSQFHPRQIQMEVRHGTLTLQAPF